ncbi:hypothetical protein A9Q74_14085 [Colwellia sp. 39_35_sub15_T18]|nr:hypothetical protein A9Q74_14085 [Colwellia sp. 39_35_sub15_T18]
MLEKLFRQIKKHTSIESPLLELLIYYFSGRAGGSRRINAIDSAKDKVQHQLSESEKDYQNDVLPVIWDFAARPYALGDILTTLIDWTVKAEKQNKKWLDIYVVATPERPASAKQPYIGSLNFEKFLFELLPAFNFCPIVRNVHLIRSREQMERTLLAWNYHRIDSSPTLNQYNDELNRQQPFMGDFKNIKAYFDEHKSVPRFRQLKSESPLKDELLFGFKPDSIFVTVHIRQRSKEVHSQHGGALYRDSDQDVWLEFINQTAKNHPNVVFVVVGRLAEFTRKLYNCHNVVILKHYGLGLIDELSAIQHSDLFMGGISGPAMFAMFTQTPYFLFQGESSAQEAATYFNENLGEESPFFTLATQKIKWLTPSVNDLNHYLDNFINNKKEVT